MKVNIHEIDLLKHIISNPEVFSEVVTKIQSKMLDEKLKPLFAAIYSLYTKGKNININTVRYHSETYYINRPGLFESIITIIDDLPEYDLYIDMEEVVTNFRKKMVQRQINEIQSILSSSKWKPDIIRQRLYSTAISIDDEEDDEESLPDTIISNESDIIPFKNPSLQMMVGGKVRGEILSIGGEPGNAKTTFAMAEALADVDQGFKVLFFSIEMAKKQLFQKWISSMCGIDSNLIIKRPKYLSEAQRKLIDNSFIEFKKKYIDSRKLIVISSMTSINEIVLEMSKYRPDVVYIDWIQMMDMPEGKDKSQGIPIIGSIAKKFAKKLNCAVVFVAQMEIRNRRGWAKRPKIDDFCDSTTFKKFSADILTLFRPYQTFQMEKRFYNILEVHYLKSRFGELGHTILHFTPETGVIQTKDIFSNGFIEKYREESLLGVGL